MIELNGYDINTAYVAAVGAVVCTRAKRYAFDVIFAGNASALLLTFDERADAVAGRSMLIAEIEGRDAPATMFGRKRVVDGGEDGEFPRASIIRRGCETPRNGVGRATPQ